MTNPNATSPTATPTSVTTCFPENGDPYRWVDINQRVPLALAKYPPDAGWAFILENQHELANGNPLLDLMKLVVEKGGDSTKILPANNRAASYVFTAKLINPEGKVVAQATSRMTVLNEKDWEIGETAALNRLYRNLGFGGYVGDEHLPGTREQQHGGGPIGSTPVAKPSGPAGSSPAAGNAPQGSFTQLARLVSNRIEALKKLGGEYEGAEITSEDMARQQLAHVNALISSLEAAPDAPAGQQPAPVVD